MKFNVTFVGLLVVAQSLAQDIKIDYDKTKDYSGYKSFRFGDSEIVTPKDKKSISDKTLDKLIKDAIVKELAEKDIMHNDSSTELVITYVAGVFEHSEMQRLGPLGTSPNSSAQTWSNNYSQGELIIDINDIQSNLLIWRINSRTNTNTPEAAQFIDQIVDKGFKKFAVKPKSKRKKK